MRVHCYIDGFNLYHAIDELGLNHLKWVNLRKLAEAFTIPSRQTLTEVYYFSAYATWRPSAMRRHQDYIAALKEHGVTPVLGHFKDKQMECKSCRSQWVKREEKESDVNIAIQLIHNAHLGTFDKALIVTADSDLCPAIRMVKTFFPTKEIEILVPPNRYDITRELRGIATTTKIKQKHLKNNLLPEFTLDSTGSVIVTRPASYNPPVAATAPAGVVVAPLSPAATVPPTTPAVPTP